MSTPYAVEMVVMATLGCSLTQAQAEYMRIEPLLINLDTPGLLGHGTVTAQTLNVRETPGSKGKLMGALAQGAGVEIWGRAEVKGDGLWLCIRTGELAGWASAQWIKEA